MFLVVAVVLLAFYFFTDVMPIWLWVLLISGSIAWTLEEPFQRMMQSRVHPRPLSRK